MKFEIKHRFSGNILFSVETESLKLAVELAVKSRADLSRAYLSGANLSGATLPTSETWETYLKEVIPALIKVGGNKIKKSAWNCHTWTNCPMAQAFNVTNIKDIPLLYKPRVEQFIQFFDAKLITEEMIKD